ncbi:MFS transporter [Longispora fulva]|uniref:CP family cyanate transporter-like MFS transporter n=1 Tax=Longispora fulva TaxID=619741 RepID=A0A8J7G696_9ACTN|nr:MFS transporter [Longispora fulva]MBG6134463.1 CP family cyanate transporter-like MFS transporter [Longispora fulva]GIG62622.1 MFS transporter [Longispora fulva]
MPTSSSGVTTPPPASAGHTPKAGALLVVGFVLLSLNTRVAFGQIGPLAPVAHFSSGAVTVLGLLPPLCMGLFAPLAPLVRRRLGEERGLLWASVVLVAGAIVRTIGMPGLYVGTVVVSLAIAIVNVLVPVLVRARFPHRHVGTMMGVYALSMGVGSAIVAAMVAPVAQASGGSWQLAIGLAVVPAVLAAVGIAPQARARRPRPTTGGTDAAAPRRHVARTGLAWSLTAFFGIQTLAFYTALAWLPSVLIASGTSRTAAGVCQAVLILGVAAGGFIAPVLAARRPDQRPHILGTVLVSAVGFTGLLLAPTGPSALWAAVLGIGLGAGQSLPGVLYARRGTDHEHVAALSTMAQTCGFLIAATGPALAAVLHGATGSWTVPLATVIAALLLGGALSMRAGHDPQRGCS